MDMFVGYTKLVVQFFNLKHIDLFFSFHNALLRLDTTFKRMQTITFYHPMKKKMAQN